MIKFELFSEREDLWVLERSRLVFSLQAVLCCVVFCFQADRSLSCFLAMWGTEEPWGEIHGVAEMEREAFEAKGMRFLGYWCSPIVLYFYHRISFLSVSCAQNIGPEIIHLSVFVFAHIASSCAAFFFNNIKSRVLL